MYRQKNLSEDFINKVIEKVAGKIPHTSLEDFLSLLENEIKNHYFTKSSESNLLRIIQNQFDVSFFVNECLKFPHQIEILVTLANNSNYLTDILVRNPEYFHWIINPSILEFKIDEKHYKDNLEKSILPFKTFDSRVNALRNFKRKEILRIGLKDIYLKEDLIRITSYLSQLANSISTVLFELCYQQVLSKHQIDKISNKYVLFSLGKLGGSELNYSSDIDLVAFIDKNNFINRKIYFQQILSETILLFIDTASKKTGSGFLYRVDFRLRPDGRNAPLCGTYAEYLRYYEMRGEDWERQMLIKANFLCGSKTLYNKFFDYLSKFVYPSSFSISPIEQIRKLKSNIEKRNSDDENIKLTSGGIRDIEFSIQAMQLLNGGKEKDLRSGNSLLTIESLSQKNILTNSEAANFNEAYIFYRRIEHYLQLMNDQQTHSIPAEGELIGKLAHFLGLKDPGSFKKYLADTKKKVHKIYAEIIGTEQINTHVNLLNTINFSDQKRAKSNFEFLRTGKSILEKKQFDSRTIASFEKIEHQLINYLRSSLTPDTILENFVRIIKSAQFPQIWYEELSDKKYFDLTLRLCEFSQKAIDLFAEDKILRDDYLSRISLISLFDIDYSKLSLKQFHFRSTIQITAKILVTNDFPKIYSNYLNQTISNTISEFAKDQKWKNNFFVAAMGSFGNSELSFSSDIDLLFVTNKISNYPTVQNDFQKLLQNLKDTLTGLEVDCRLRPEGKSSQLVWDIEDYKKYFANRARVWELQAFTKCRFVYGDQNLFKHFYTEFWKVVESKDQLKIKTEMIEMRKKLLPINDGSFNIKKSSGGLYDIDFIKSFVKLTSQNYDEFGINFEELENNFNFLKQIELLNQNIYNSKLSKIPTDEAKLNKLSSLLGYENAKMFYKKLNEVIQLNRKFYQNIFN